MCALEEPGWAERSPGCGCQMEPRQSPSSPLHGIMKCKVSNRILLWASFCCTENTVFASLHQGFFSAFYKEAIMVIVERWHHRVRGEVGGILIYHVTLQWARALLLLWNFNCYQTCVWLELALKNVKKTGVHHSTKCKRILFSVYRHAGIEAKGQTWSSTLETVSDWLAGGANKLNKEILGLRKTLTMEAQFQTVPVQK